MQSGLRGLLHFGNLSGDQFVSSLQHHAGVVKRLASRSGAVALELPHYLGICIVPRDSKSTNESAGMNAGELVFTWTHYCSRSHSHCDSDPGKMVHYRFAVPRAFMPLGGDDSVPLYG